MSRVISMISTLLAILSLFYPPAAYAEPGAGAQCAWLVDHPKSLGFPFQKARYFHFHQPYKKGSNVAYRLSGELLRFNYGSFTVYKDGVLLPDQTGYVDYQLQLDNEDSNPYPAPGNSSSVRLGSKKSFTIGFGPADQANKPRNFVPIIEDGTYSVLVRYYGLDDGQAETLPSLQKIDSRTGEPLACGPSELPVVAPFDRGGPRTAIDNTQIVIGRVTGEGLYPDSLLANHGYLTAMWGGGFAVFRHILPARAPGNESTSIVDRTLSPAWTGMVIGSITTLSSDSLGGEELWDAGTIEDGERVVYLLSSPLDSAEVRAVARRNRYRVLLSPAEGPAIGVFRVKLPTPQDPNDYFKVRAYPASFPPGEGAIDYNAANFINTTVGLYCGGTDPGSDCLTQAKRTLKRIAQCQKEVRDPSVKRDPITCLYPQTFNDR